MRRIGIAFGAALALVFGALPASAAQPVNSSITGAEAQWYFTDQGGIATGVMIRPVREVDSASGHAITVGVNVQVEQAYTDPATGEDQFRLLVSRPYYAPATSISVDRSKGASVRATVNLFDDSTGAGPYTVTVAADWTPVGDTTRRLSNVWDTEGGMWWLRRSNGTTTPAIATGAVTGALSYGSLGEAEGLLATGHDFNKFVPPPMSSVLLRQMVDIYSAEARSTYRIDGADSTWELGDAQGTSVVMGVTQNHTAGGAHSAARVSLEIYAGYYDAATKEDVWYDVGGEATLSQAAVDSSLQRASVSVTIVVSGFEQRAPAGTSDWTETAIGPVPMTVVAEWTATGAIEHYRWLFLEKGVDYSSKDRYYDRARQAAATGTIAGSLVTANLTNVQNAFMYDETRTITTR